MIDHPAIDRVLSRKPRCKWCNGTEDAPRHDFDDPNNHAAAKHVFDPVPEQRLVMDESIVVLTIDAYGNVIDTRTEWLDLGGEG